MAQESDPLDQAINIYQEHVDTSVNKIRRELQSTSHHYAPTKECIVDSCGEDSMPNSRFCSVECRNEHERLIKLGRKKY